MAYIPDEPVSKAAHELINDSIQLAVMADHALRGGPLNEADRKCLRDLSAHIVELTNALAGPIDANALDEQE